MVPVARRNLFAEKTRLAISVAGVAFAVILILIVLALYRGWSGVGGIIEELPGDLWVVQIGTTDPLPSASLLPEETADEEAGGVALGASERFFPAPGEMAIDSVFARKSGLEEGEVVDLGSRQLRVSRVFSGGNAVITQFAFI